MLPPKITFKPDFDVYSWAYPWAPGSSLANLFALYPSLGNVTLGADIATTLDGPMQVVRYGDLTINAARTVTNRCRGLVVLCDSLTMGASGALSMTGRGAAGSSKWANQDIVIPAIALAGKNTGLQAYFAWLATNGYAIFDPTLYAVPLPGMGDVQCDWATWTAYGLTMISKSGCGVPALGSLNGLPGATGGAGTNAPGAGGGGGAGSSTTISGSGGAGRVWGGGVGGGGSAGTPTVASLVVDQYGGPGGASCSNSAQTGGGAGNPGGSGLYGGSAGGSGTGGVLIVIVRGAVNLTAGHAITANGVNGGAATTAPGGSSGGGFAGLYYSGSLTGSPNLTVTGGSAVTGGYNGGAGGAGATQVKTFATMTW